MEGLRERKKRETREAIAATALRLFGERGFEQVTVAEIARAADVSEQTVYNHFPTKEQLVFGGGEEHIAELVASVRERPAGSSIVHPFRERARDFVEGLEEGRADYPPKLADLVWDSPTLRLHLSTGWIIQAGEVGKALAQELGRPEDDAASWALAAALLWTFRSIFQAALMRLREGEDRVAIAKRLREEAEFAFDALEAGLGRYGV
jgi:AcrR family transcriptional regulator